jgi:signal transduction histidine kinase
MVIPYSRAVFDRSGGVAGVVVAELRAEYLAGLYAGLTAGINASVVVFNHDGIILMRVPYDEKFLGRSASDPDTFRKQLKGSGNIEFTSVWDGKTRYYSHRVMRGDPVLIAVGIDKDDVMAPSAVRTRHRVAVIGTATLFLVALVWLLVADLRRLTRGEERLRESFARLQELSRRLVEVEESERRNINRELHDRVGQNLSALNLSLGIMRNTLAEGPPHEVSARLDDARMLLEITSKEVRDVMAELRPPALDEFGLVAALRDHCAAVAARLGLAITVEGKALDPRLPPTTETALFRIVQEALNNVGKHARAREVRVVLAESTGGVTLTVTDDGVGFDAAQRVQAAPTYGIVTMHERAEAVGARLTIASTPGAGTRVAIGIARVRT